MNLPINSDLEQDQLDNYDFQMRHIEFKKWQKEMQAFELALVHRLMRLVTIGFLSADDFQYLKNHFDE